MKTNEENKALIIASITKMVTDKEAVRSYIKGKIDLKTIENKGIKFARPI